MIDLSAALTNVRFQGYSRHREFMSTRPSTTLAGSFTLLSCADPSPAVRASLRRRSKHEITTPIRDTEAPLNPLHVQEWFVREFQHLCESALGGRAKLRTSHPVAIAELYALPTALGRAVRLSVNILAKLGYNAFSRPAGFRAWSAQMAVAQKPRDPQA